MAVSSQALQALAQANDVRAVRARLKRRLATSELRAADVLVTPPREAARMEIAAVLGSQRGWGPRRCQRFLARLGISERKPIGSLTDRQRLVLAAQLAPSAQPPGTTETPDRVSR